MKTFKVVCVAIVCLIGLLCGLLSMRRDWVKPCPGISLEPCRPFLHVEDVPPDGAAALLLAADSAILISRPTAYEEMHQLTTQRWSEARFTNVTYTLEACATNLAFAARAVAAGDGQMPTLTSFEDYPPYSSSASRVGRLLTVRALRRAAAGDYDGAFFDLETTMGCANLVSKGGVLVNGLIEMSLIQGACETMHRVMCTHVVPSPIMRQAGDDLAKWELRIEPLAEILRQECRFAASTVGVIYGETNACGSSWFYGAESPLLQLVRALGPLVGSTPRSTRRNIESCYSHLIYFAENPLDRKGRDAFRNTFDTGEPWSALMLLEDPVGYVFAANSIRTADRALDQSRVRTFNMRALRVYIAVALFERARGRLPDSLRDLVPEYLATVPDDPFGRTKL